MRHSCFDHSGRVDKNAYLKEYAKFGGGVKNFSGKIASANNGAQKYFGAPAIFSCVFAQIAYTFVIIHHAFTRMFIQQERAMNNVAIFWDIENVKPSSTTLFVDGLLNYVEELGKMSYSVVVGDWSHNINEAIPLHLSENGFELIYIPQPKGKGKRKKNSADIILITKATEMIFQLPHINTYVVITGDIDFRPLLQILKKHGKEVIVICDARNASESLLEYADDYKDYRGLLPDDENEPSPADTQSSAASAALSKREAFKILRESVSEMIQHKKIPTPGSVKVRMRLLNENFQGTVEGVKKWQDFINDAVKNNIIAMLEDDGKVTLSLPTGTQVEDEMPRIFKELLSIIAEQNGKDEWVKFNKINTIMLAKGMKIKEYNYSKFKKLMMDAEKRGLIETKNKGFQWYAKAK